MRRVSCASTRAASICRVLSLAFDGLAGDLVEHHAMNGNLGLQHLEQVPGDGLTLAVLISCEVELAGAWASARLSSATVFFFASLTT